MPRFKHCIFSSSSIFHFSINILLIFYIFFFSNLITRQELINDVDPSDFDADPDNKFVYMTMAFFFSDFLYCRD